MTERMVSMPLGVVVERREIDNPWQDHEWRPVAVIPGAAPVEEWIELARDESAVRYLAATLPLEPRRRETEAYLVNFSNEVPLVYVLLTSDDEAGANHEVKAVLVTASPYEAQDYLDAGEDVVEGVAMPDGVIAWVQAFIDRHHVDEPFKKRKCKRHDPDKNRAGRSAVAPDARAKRDRFV